MADTAPVIIDTHTHVIAADTVRYPLNKNAGIANDWVHESPVDVAAAAGGDGSRRGTRCGARAGSRRLRVRQFLRRRRAAEAPSRLVNAAVIDMSAADRGRCVALLVEGPGNPWPAAVQHPAGRPRRGSTPTDAADVVRLAHAAGVRVSACVLAPDLPAIATLLGRAPDVPIALDHCGFVDLREGFRSPGAQALAVLADHDNVRLKVTTTLFEGAAEAGLDPRDVLEWLCACFGARRLMWGSDYPQYHRESYPAIVALGKRACSRLSADEQAAFLGGTALELWPELAPDQPA